MEKIFIDKNAVLKEVEMTSAYAGAKTGEYDKLAAIKDDKEMLERFWRESCNSISMALRHIIADEKIDASGATYTLSVPARRVLASSLSSYCVEAILAKWLALANHEEAKDYAAVATQMLDEACRDATPRVFRRSF